MPMEVFDDRVCALGEGPVYDDRTGRAYWVDVPGHRVLWRDLADGTRGEFATAADVSAAIPREKGGFVLLLPTGPTLVDPTGVVETTIAYEGADAGTALRCNDAKADPVGRLWFGTMAYDERPGAASLYRLDPGATVLVPVCRDITVSNGLGWSADNTLMYYADTPTQRIDVFDYDLATGTASDRRSFVDVSPAHPDGLCTDAEGAVWVAFWGSGMVRRYLPDGRLEREVAVPTPYTTSCAFAGPDHDLLIITTAATRGAAGTPEAGLTYAYRPGDVVGRPVHRYAG
jgi:sugar lactone lactonase YvrE